MGECVRDGCAGQEETSGMNRDKTEHLKLEEALQPVLAWCLPLSPCRDCTGLVESLPCSADSRQLLHLRGNTLKSKCCLLATRQACKKSGLPVCMGIRSKQLEPEVHMNISSLALIALAIDKVKQPPTTLWWKRAAARQHAGQREGDAAFESRQIQHVWPEAHSLHVPQDSHLVTLCAALPPESAPREGHCGNLLSTEVVLHLESFTIGEGMERPSIRSHKTISLSFLNCCKPLNIGITGRWENPAKLSSSSCMGIINLPRNPSNTTEPYFKKDLLKESKKVNN